MAYSPHIDDAQRAGIIPASRTNLEGARRLGKAYQGRAFIIWPEDAKGGAEVHATG